MVLTEGRISLRVMTEVSEVSTENALTGGAGGTTIPSIKTRRAETTLEIPSGGSIAMAGLIQEQTKQAVNGMPGWTRFRFSAQLFRSQDFVNRQTELMVIVTPYVVRAVAQKELSRPDDGFAPARIPNRRCWRKSPGSTALPAASKPIAPTTATSASSPTETDEPADGDEDRTMTSTTPMVATGHWRLSAPCSALQCALGACNKTTETS